MDKFIDWHLVDVITRLREWGTSLAAESQRYDLSSSTLANALTHPWPKGELIIVTALGTQPWVIWPLHYHDSVTYGLVDRTRVVRQKKTDR